MQAVSIPDKPPKPKLQRERDTVERDLIFDDHAQNHRMLMKLNDHRKTIALIQDALKAGDLEAVRVLTEKAADETERMIAVEQEDVKRHQFRAQLYQFKAREKGRKGDDA